MRNGPSVHRQARVLRFISGAPAPLERLAALGGLSVASQFERRANCAAAPAGQSPRLYLGSRLPINLRRFLAEELGGSMRVDSDGIVALEPRPAETLMRELARAIRRFSAERARQAWSECGASLARLKSEFMRAPASHRRAVVLCLRCACIGAGPMNRHRGRECLPVELDSGLVQLEAPREPGSPNLVADALLQAVENFRMEREAAGLPHHDLDCFVANGQVVFTWRPLPRAPRHSARLSGGERSWERD